MKKIFNWIYDFIFGEVIYVEIKPSSNLLQQDQSHCGQFNTSTGNVITKDEYDRINS